MTNVEAAWDELLARPLAPPTPPKGEPDPAVRAAFDYVDGKLTRKSTGKSTWCLRGRGYPVARFEGRVADVHVLVWRYFFGAVPDGFEIDHISGDRTDPRIEGLRLLTPRQNKRNARVHRAGAFPGVCRSGNGWEVQVSFADAFARKHFTDHTLACEQARVWHWLGDVHPRATVALALAFAITPQSPRGRRRKAL